MLLYELLTGTTPLTKQRLQQVAFTEMLRLIREEEPPKPSTRLSDSKDSLPAISAQRHLEPAQLTKLVRGELDWIVMKALEKDRNRRYETANGLARDLERYLHDESVEACPPSAGYRLGKLARKHRRLLATAAAFAGLLLLGAAVSTWLAVRATVAERQARAERDVAEQARAEEAAQRRQAEAERERARAAEALAAAVNDFLRNDLLAQADPSAQADLGQSPDQDLKLRTVRDRAAARIGERFPDQPLVEAATRQTIGDAYRGLGEYELAQAHLEAALGIRRQQLGEDHPDTLTSQNNLAVLYRSQGQLARAELVFRDVLERRRRRLGVGHPDVAATLASLGLTLLQQRKYAEAEPLLRDCVKIYEPQRPDAWEMFHAQALLGGSLLGQQQYAAAEPLLLSGYQGLQQRADTMPAEDQIRLSEALERLVQLHDAWGKPDEAAKWRKELEALRPPQKGAQQ